MKVQSILRRLGAASLVLLAACGGSGGDSSAGLPRTPAATTMTLADNGFTFANFSAKKTTEQFDESDLVAMFGATPEVCTGGTEPCRPTPEAAAFARMVNQARASGHCEGLVALAASRFLEKVTPSTGELPRDTDVVHAIFRAFATQFLPESQDLTGGWAKKSLEEVLAELQSNLAEDRPEYTLNLYTDNGGHAVLPTAIEFPDNDTALVRVYDSNWPGKDRYVTFDLKKKEWSFSFAGRDPGNDPNAWTGGKGDVDLTSLASRTTSSCPFCGDGASVRNTLLVIRSVDKKIEVTTDSGTVTPDSPVAGDITIKPLAGPGAEPAEGEPRDYIVSIPAGNKSTKVKAGTEARIVAITPDAVAEATTPAGGSSSPIQFLPGSIAVSDATIQLTLAAGDFVITSSGENNTITAGDNGVSATVDNAAGAPVTVETTTEQPAVEVVAGGAEELPEGASYVVATQASDGVVEVTTFAPDGSSSTQESEGTLGNTGVTPDLSDPLAATNEVPGLPPEAERSSEPSTSTTVPASTTSSIATADNSGVDTGGGSGGNQTTQTTKPRSTTTVPKSTARTAVTVGINLDEWGFGANDPESSGFDATLAVTGSDNQRCSTAVCLEGLVVEGTASGTDAATGRTVTTSATFTMKAMSVPFSLRCGNAGSWVAATGSAGAYTATCQIASVTQDETVYIRT
ncbi:MAG: hypothetical protein ACO36A_02755 [Ilumatobacteraceae bacterium]